MKKKSTVFSVVVLGFVTLVIVFYMSFVDGWSNMIKALEQAKLVWLLVAVLLIVAYWLTEAMSVYAIGKKLYKPLTFRQSVKTVMIGQLFNCITPFATGGQPMQAYYMVQRGVPAGLATLSLLARFLVYQVILTVYSLVALFSHLSYFTSHVSSLGYIVLIGFLVNAAVVAGLIMVNFFPSFSKKAALRIIGLAYKLKIVKDKDAASEKALVQIELFYENVHEIKRYSSSIIWMSLITVVQLTAFFAIPYFLTISLGGDIPFTDALYSSSFVHMVSSFVPLPGAAGGAEGGFFLFFNEFIKNEKILTTTIILWRFITFYLPMLIGACFANRLRKIYKTEQNNKNKKPA